MDARSGVGSRNGPGARILAPTAEGIALAAAALARGEPVGMPTETVYGLAASCWDERAVARVFAAKDRPRFDPLIVHVAEGVRSVAALAELGLVDAAALGAAGIDAADALCGAFWPGPLTLVLPKTARVPDIVTAGLATVAVRAPRHPVAQALIAAAGVPLAAPSANRFGRISPTSASSRRSSRSIRAAGPRSCARAGSGARSWRACSAGRLGNGARSGRSSRHRASSRATTRRARRC